MRANKLPSDKPLSIICLSVTLTLFALVSEPAQAVEIAASGGRIIISGPIRSGDEFKLQEVLASPAGQAARVVVLNSPGGRINSAGEMGRQIRRRGLATLVDGRSGNCASACTVIFAAGASRHYVNAGAVAEGVFPKAGRGLGFHEGNESTSQHANRYSGRATGNMVGWYSEFGMSGAGDLVSKAPPDKMYRINVATALARGIATSLSAP